MKWVQIEMLCCPLNPILTMRMTSKHSMMLCTKGNVIICSTKMQLFCNFLIFHDWPFWNEAKKQTRRWCGFLRSTIPNPISSLHFRLWRNLVVCCLFFRIFSSLFPFPQSWPTLFAPFNLFPSPNELCMNRYNKLHQFRFSRPGFSKACLAFLSSPWHVLI